MTMSHLREIKMTICALGSLLGAQRESLRRTNWGVGGVGSFVGERGGSREAVCGGGWGRTGGSHRG